MKKFLFDAVEKEDFELRHATGIFHAGHG